MILRNYIPGQHGPRSKPRLSEYGRQLQEKQKAQNIYNITATQLKTYFSAAAEKEGATDEILLQLLETRLDNVVYRLGFADSRRQARNYIKDGHILVNGRTTTVPGKQVKESEVISFKTLKKGIKEKFDDKKEKISTPNWLKLEKKTFSGQLVHKPLISEIETDFDKSLLIEYYSR
jgi:small subunit ribosomal protein S4